jgi:predicted secreted protein
MRDSKMGKCRAILLAAAVLGVAATAAAATRTVTISEAFDGGLVNLAPGDELVVRLSGNAGTGYVWTLAFLNADVLKPEGGSSAEQAPIPGAPGVKVFRFRAANRGPASVGFAYGRPSENDAAPARLFRALVMVGVTVAPRHHNARDTDDSSRLFLTQGDTLYVRLPATPSTGYGWTITRNAPSVLKPAGEPKWEGPTVPGAEGTQVLEFQVVGPGADWLELTYRRPFDPDSKAVKTWNLFVATAGLATK